LLFQLKYKEKTDFELMCKYILKRANSTEFFVRKAIGWVLRQYSKYNPEAVINFVEQHKTELSNLSQKEALKVINRKK